MQEIEEQIAAGKLNVAIYGTTTFNELTAMLPNAVCKNGEIYAQLCFVGKYQVKFFTLTDNPTHEFYTIDNDNHWHINYAPVDWSQVSNKPFNTVGDGLNTASESLSLDTSYLPTVSAGSGVTVTPTTDGNHTKYEISSTGGGGGGTGSVSWSGVTDKPFNSVGTGLNTVSESLSLDTSYLPTVSAGSGVTVTPITDGNHTKYEISSTGGGGTGGITSDTTWAEMES